MIKIIDSLSLPKDDPMPLEAEHITWLAKLAYSGVSAACGGLCAAFVLGVKMNKRDAANARRDERIDELFKAKDEQDAFCKVRWEAITKHQEESAKLVSERICASVRQMISDVKVDQAEDLADIKVSIGILLDRTNPDDDLKKLLRAHLDRRATPREPNHGLIL